ncbi:MAG: hypothetical protein ACRD40_02710 [Candidatus Acidiferrales bacterium]
MSVADVLTLNDPRERSQGLLFLRSASLGPVVHAGGSLAGNDSWEASSTASQVHLSEELAGSVVFSDSFAADLFFSEGMRAFLKYRKNIADADART